ncbi:amino acid ABC transporter permease [Hamadaea tsunoensis]|uniref:amino acid ABC transporter permease n=1 Tax=Hamadaea tsunoensis TaxID=53368 RepID=UPI0003F973C8|nr:amino acid ABC transporter permease [Hamadaea tsunoensis]
MEVFSDKLDVFWNGFLGTVQMCLLAAVGALILGALVAVLRISPIPPLRAVGTAYVTVFRNVPLTVVMFFAAFALPLLGSDASFLKIPGLRDVIKPLGTDLPYFRFATIALTLYTTAFVCEALRSGIGAVPLGQAEAARSLGLSFTQNLRHVVLPQAWKLAIVPLGSVIIAMVKNSALAAAFGVIVTLMGVVDELVSQQYYDAVPVFLGVAVGFLILTIPLGLLLDMVERSQKKVATR